MPSESSEVHLLIVDDNSANLLAFKTTLEPLGHPILTAASGVDALKLARTHEFAAIVLDVRMPIMDGFETAGLFRQMSGTAHTPIIFISAYDHSREHIGKGYLAGATEFLVSPVDPELLRFKVAAYVEIHQGVRALKARTEELTRIIEALRAEARLSVPAQDALNERIDELEASFRNLKEDIHQQL